jgi:hypothetical protein
MTGVFFDDSLLFFEAPHSYAHQKYVQSIATVPEAHHYMSKVLTPSQLIMLGERKAGINLLIKQKKQSDLARSNSSSTVPSF